MGVRIDGYLNLGQNKLAAPTTLAAKPIFGTAVNKKVGI